MATQPLILNNPILTKALQDRAAQPQQPQGLGAPAPQGPPPVAAHIQVTHTTPDEGPDLGTSVPGAPPQGLAQRPVANTGPLTKIAPPQPNAAELGHQTEYNRLTAPPPADKSLVHTKANTGAPGVQQIHNPFLRGLATVGDAIGSGLFPNIAMNIPGTTAHHGLLVQQQHLPLEQEQKNRKDTATEELDAAKAEHQINTETAAQRAVTPHTVTTAEGIKQFNPETGKFDIEVGAAPGKEEEAGKTVTTDQGIMQWNPQSKRYDIAVGNAPGAKGGSIHQLEDGTFILAHPDGTATPLTINGQPAKGATKSEGKTPLEEQVINEHLSKVHPGETMAMARQHTQPAPQRDPEVALDRESTRFAKPHEKAVSDAATQLEKIADAKAMINGNAEAQAVGLPKVLTALVSGQGSGVRITQAEMNAIAKARGIGGSLEGFVNQVSGKGKLTATQQQQLSQILDDVAARVQQKQAIANEALNNINSARSREEIIGHDKTARQKLTELEKTAGASAAPEVKTKAEYDKLPSGAVYMEDGKRYRKP